MEEHFPSMVNPERHTVLVLATVWTPLTLRGFIQNMASILLAVMVANDDISASDCA
jgi:hypothetical protein